MTDCRKTQNLATITAPFRRPAAACAHHDGLTGRI